MLYTSDLNRPMHLSTSVQHDQRWPQNGTPRWQRWPQDGSKITPRWLKIFPRWRKMAPMRTEMVPLRPKMAPIWPATAGAQLLRTIFAAVFGSLAALRGHTVMGRNCRCTAFEDNCCCCMRYFTPSTWPRVDGMQLPMHNF
jgi:hypothetical protein